MKNDFMQHFEQVEDPRVQGRVLHPAENILFITIIAAICGIDEWEDIALFAKCREDFFKKHLKLENGLPSPDTIARFFQIIDPKSFQKAFMEWTKSLIEEDDQTQTVSIDGKRIRTASMMNDKYPIHIVSAWASGNQVVLGQVKVADKSNEITAIPKLLEMLDIEGDIVTIDAMGTQTEIAKKITEKKADYVLSVKDNQRTLKEDIEQIFESKKSSEVHLEEDYGHGRIEERRYYYSNEVDRLLSPEKWSQLTGIVKVERKSTNKKTGVVSEDIRYFITSSSDEKRVYGAIRQHWGVESMHWILDVCLNEDKSLKRAGYAAENFNIIRKMVINMMKNDDYDFGVKKKIPIKRKMLIASNKEDYIEHLISKL